MGASSDLLGPLAVEHMVSGVLVAALLDGREGGLEAQQPMNAHIEAHVNQDALAHLIERVEEFEVAAAVGRCVCDIRIEHDKGFDLRDAFVRKISTDPYRGLTDGVLVGLQSDALVQEELFLEGHRPPPRSCEGSSNARPVCVITGGDGNVLLAMARAGRATAPKVRFLPYS